MLKRLPNEVEALIYDFLFLPKDVRKISCLSKYMKERAKNIKFIKQKEKIHERTRMLIEDQNSYRYQSDDIANAWEQYYKWNWPENRANIEYNTTPLWKVGTYVDVEDKIKVWGSALILKTRIIYKAEEDDFQLIRKYTVQFIGWSESFNEEVEGDKIARFGEKCMNPRCKFDSLTKDHKRWVLYLDLGMWKLEALSIDREKSTDKKLVCSIVNKDIEITRENIEKILRSVTNATVFLSNPDRHFKPDVRQLSF